MADLARERLDAITCRRSLRHGAILELVAPMGFDSVFEARLFFATEGESDGDRIFTSWSGSFTPAGALNGMNEITGGTGKFSGVRGKAPFQCRALNADNQWTCTQQFEYRLP